MIYERAKDREREEDCAWMLEYRGFEARVTPTDAPYDIYVEHNGNPHAVVEYKHRTKQYDPYMIDCSKIDTLLEIAGRHDIKPVLIVEWDGINGYWCWECVNDMPKGKLKRTKPRGIEGETQDDEDDVYEIPISAFTQL